MLWKIEIKKDNGNSKNSSLQDHHLIKKRQIFCLAKLNSKEIYNIQVFDSNLKPTSQSYYENLFERLDLDWKKIYLLPRLTSSDTSLRVFQYKILNNVLFLNKMLFQFKKSPSPFCSFCNVVEETPIHIFYSCLVTQNLWLELQTIFTDHLIIPNLTPQSAIFGFLDTEPNSHLILNHLLLIFKFYIYKARETKTTHINILKSNIQKILDIEKKTKKSSLFLKKWQTIQDVLR